MLSLVQSFKVVTNADCLFLPKALSSSAEKYPMFVFEKGKGREEEVEGSSAPTNIAFIQRNLRLTSQDDADNSMDEFVLLWTEISVPQWHLLSVWRNNVLRSSDLEGLCKANELHFGELCCDLFTCNKWFLHSFHLMNETWFSSKVIFILIKLSLIFSDKFWEKRRRHSSIWS